MTYTHKYHGLPEDGDDLDSSWFERLTGFQKGETRRQVKIKRDEWPYLNDGFSSKRAGYYYPHILPEGHLEKNFYPPIYDDVLKYLTDEGIELHTEALNLLSSQVCCFNFLFPLKKDLKKAASLLSFAIPGLEQVLHIEFEYAGPDSATEWLGEPHGGRRGLNRTSIDAAVWWKDQDSRKRLTFIEWKYTEKEFGGCGGYRSKGNKERAKCRRLQALSIQPKQDCYISTGRDDRTSRRYWDLLARAGISMEYFRDRLGCPFLGPFYQLMRQYLLAAYCKDTFTEIGDVNIVVMCFKGNHDLLQVPHNLRHLGEDVISAWNSLLTTAIPLRSVFVEDLLANATNDDWRDYIRKRYKV